jgi:gliding motility-associated-like protein
MIWSRTYGGIERDKGIGLRHNADDTYLICAYTSSPVFGNTDVSMDPLFIKTDTAGMVSCQVHTPNVTVQNVTLNIVSDNNISNASITLFPANSIVSPYLPTDTFQCLQCNTQPLFQANDTVVCINDPILVFNTTQSGLRCFQQWNVDGNIYDGAIDTINYSWSVPGVYPIKLYSHCGMATDTFRLNIHVHPPPDARFNASDHCLNDTTHFLNTTTIPLGSVSAWTWDLGDGTTSSDENPDHYYTNAGTFIVNLSATTLVGCSNSISDTVTVFEIPTANFNSLEVCLNDSSEFNNSSFSSTSIVNYEWDLGDGTLSSALNITHAYNSPGTYNVILHITDQNGCEDEHQSNTIIHPVPHANFNVTDHCLNDSTHFLNTTTISIDSVSAWTWNLGDGTISTDENPDHYYLHSGTFIVNLSAITLFGCSNSIADTLSVFDSPTAGFMSDGVCLEDTTKIYNTSHSNTTITNQEWDLGDGSVSSTLNIAHTYNAPGTYNVKLHVTDQNGCEDEYLSSVEIYPTPAADFTSGELECDLSPVHFKNESSDGVTWLWDFGDGNFSNEINPSHIFMNRGKYEVRLFATSDKGCVDSVSGTLDVMGEFYFWIPNAFTPNGDHINDLFKPVTDLANNFKMDLFDRWGTLIFHSEDLESGWNALIDGRQAQSDVYVYKISVRDFCDQEHNYIGHVTLVR